jgi:von Hippel-Lindau disease tumor suppressor protein
VFSRKVIATTTGARARRVQHRRLALPGTARHQGSRLAVTRHELALIELCDDRLVRGAGFALGFATVLLIAAAVVVTAGPAVGAVRAAAGACNITQTKSISASVKTKIEFVNKTAGTVKVYWLDYTGKRVYYWTLAPGASYAQATFDTNPWVVLTSSGGCIGYVIAPKSQYVISGTATAPPPPTTTAVARAQTPAEPHWVYQMINDFNLGISQPSGVLSLSSLIYTECVKVPPDLAFIDGNSRNMAASVQTQFATYSRLIPGWIGQISKLKSTPVTRLAKAKLVAAVPLHEQEVGAWEGAAGAIKIHNCSSFIADLRAAQQAGAPDWADQYTAVNAIARLYGSNAASHQTPYAQKLG